jgi:histone deacetylase 1/2
VSRSQSPAGVVTPPESPLAPASTSTLAPAADVEMGGATEDAAVKEEVVLKQEGETERDTENVKGEVRTEFAKTES